jgi:hypothetical protein
VGFKLAVSKSAAMKLVQNIRDNEGASTISQVIAEQFISEQSKLTDIGIVILDRVVLAVHELYEARSAKDGAILFLLDSHKGILDDIQSTALEAIEQFEPKQEN